MTAISSTADCSDSAVVADRQLQWCLICRSRARCGVASDDTSGPVASRQQHLT